ncbi:MAG: hypothetical protein INR73_05825 [Williamsia sp.]|nr:hypothetical protein [Williamsia sp.]
MNILFLAEAAVDKDKHFYAGNTVLFRAVMTAFEQQFGLFGSNNAFLEFFRTAGCRLDHLCPENLSGLVAKQRLQKRRSCIAALAEKLAADPPLMVIVVMKAILPEVMEAIRTASLQRAPLVRATPFPVRSEQNRLNCIAGISAALKEAVTNKMLACG